jgi:hypothetical protein
VTFIETTNGQTLEPRAVRVALIGTLTLLAKLAKIPDIDHVHDAVRAAHAETITAAENTASAIESIQTNLNKTNALVQRTISPRERIINSDT